MSGAFNMSSAPDILTRQSEGRIGVVFAMRYPDDVGFVWNNMAALYDKCADMLGPSYRTYVAYPQLTANPAYRPVWLTKIKAALYEPGDAAAIHIASELFRALNVRILVFGGCDPGTIDLVWIRSLGVRTINLELDSYPEAPSRYPVKQAVKTVTRRWLKWNLHDLYIANAAHQRRFLIQFAKLPPDRVVAVHNGVDTDRFSPGTPPDPKAFGLPVSRHYAVSVFQARPEKRIDYLIDVAAELFRRWPELSLTFVHVGTGQTLPRAVVRVKELVDRTH